MAPGAQGSFSALALLDSLLDLSVSKGPWLFSQASVGCFGKRDNNSHLPLCKVLCYELLALNLLLGSNDSSPGPGKQGVWFKSLLSSLAGKSLLFFFFFLNLFCLIWYIC